VGTVTLRRAHFDRGFLIVAVEPSEDAEDEGEEGEGEEGGDVRRNIARIGGFANVEVWIAARRAEKAERGRKAKRKTKAEIASRKRKREEDPDGGGGGQGGKRDRGEGGGAIGILAKVVSAL